MRCDAVLVSMTAATNVTPAEMVRYTAGARVNWVRETSHAAAVGVVPPRKASDRLYPTDSTVHRTRHGASPPSRPAAPAHGSDNSASPTCPPKIEAGPRPIRAISGYANSMRPPAATISTRRRPTDRWPCRQRDDHQQQRHRDVLISSAVFAGTPTLRSSQVAE